MARTRNQEKKESDKTGNEISVKSQEKKSYDSKKI